MDVLIFLCPRTIIITSEIPTFGNHIPGEAGTTSSLPGNRRILVLHSRAGRYSPVDQSPKELYGFPGRPEQNRSNTEITVADEAQEIDVGDVGNTLATSS